MRTHSAMNPKEISRLTQDVHRVEIETLFDGPWILLYRCPGEQAWYSALLAPENITKALDRFDWDVNWRGGSRPSYTVSHRGSDTLVKYRRFQEEGVEPLVIIRDIDNQPPLVELFEELRLFLDLFTDGKGNLFRINQNGRHEIVVTISSEEVRILKEPLLKFLRAKQMHLAIYFDHQVWFSDISDNPLPEEKRLVEVASSDRRWNFGASAETGELFSRLCGKRLLAPPASVQANDVFDRHERYVDFIIGYDEKGHHLEYSANPAHLADFFGTNSDAPNYLTPVHFSREVLDRYYHNPSRYNVSDGVVWCGSLRLIRMDDDHADCVVAFLGDLGRDLPYEEQLHWRAHNIAPDGALSRTATARCFEARPVDGSQPEHRFKVALVRFTNAWIRTHSWPLFRPLDAKDLHVLVKLHVPTSDNPAELDAQLLGLAKILVDSLNDKALDAVLAAPIEREKSLAKLERYLRGADYAHADRDIAILRTIQNLRSTGAAHRRGSGYDKAVEKLGLTGRSAPEIMTQLLEGVIAMLDDLSSQMCASIAHSRTN